MHHGSGSGDVEGLDLEAVPGGAGNGLAGAEAELAVAAHHGGAIVVDVAKEATAGVAEDAGAPSLDTPVVDRLEEGHDPVFLGEAEPGVVDPGEGEGALISGLEVGIRRIQVRRAQVQVRSAPRAPAINVDYKVKQHKIDSKIHG